MSNVTEFLLARIAEDEQSAQLAIQEARPDSHWQWADVETDEPLAPGEMAERYRVVTLRTVKEFPTTSGVGDLPAFVTHSPIDDIDPGAADHIARWDPARVLAECASKRAQVEFLTDYMKGDYAPWNEDHLAIMAAVYSDHPDYREEWKPEDPNAYVSGTHSGTR